jgi:hypothetical protein
MRAHTKLFAATAAVALGLAPAAYGHGQGGNGHGQAGSGGNGNAFARLCQSESKKHVAGQKGTPFSDCVTDMAQLASGAKTNPHRACANESKKHVTRQKGTPYSQCVSAAAKLQGEPAEGSSESSSMTSGSTIDDS